MSRKKVKRRKRKYTNSTKTKKTIEKMRWMLSIDSQEAVVNFYMILRAFQESDGNGYFNKEALQYIDKWINVILNHDPDIEERASNNQGPFRERDTSPLTISLELDHKEKELMLVIWKMMYSQLITPKMRAHWVENQGQKDYMLALKNYESWINTLEGEGYIVSKTKNS